MSGETAMIRHSASPHCPGRWLAAVALWLGTLLTPLQAASVSPQLYQRLEQASRLADNAPGEAIALLHAYQPTPGRDQTQWQRFQGQLYTRLGDYRQAAELLTRAVDSNLLSDDEQHATLLLLGEVHLHQQHYGAAERRLEQALGLCRQGCDATLLRLGYSSYYQGEYDKALSWLARQTSPERTSLLLALNCQQRLKAWPQAIVLQQQLLQGEPHSLSHWRNLAYLYVNNGQPAEAAGVLLLAQQAAALTHERDWRWLAELLAEAGAPGYAAWLLEQGIAEHRLTVTPALQQARLTFARRAGDHRRAAELYRQRYAREGRLEDRLGLLTELQRFDPQAALTLLTGWPAEQKTAALWLQQLNLLVQAGAWHEAAQVAQHIQADPRLAPQALAWLTFIEQRQRLTQ